MSLFIQEANAMKIPKDTLHITIDDLNTKAELDATTDSCWVLKAGPSMRKKGKNGTFVCVVARMLII